MNDQKRLVNCWNGWDPLEEIVVGTADYACLSPDEPAYYHFPPEGEVWQHGPRSKIDIDKANKQINGLVDVLENQLDIIVKRTRPLDITKPTSNPFWNNDCGKAITCPREVCITIGNTIVEAPMSERNRYFEYLANRDIIMDYYKRDLKMNWVVAPKPKMWDKSYNKKYWEMTEEELVKSFRDGPTYDSVINEDEIFFDAADILRMGQDVFLYRGMTTNQMAVEWFQREFPDLTISSVICPDDVYANHIDCNVVPLREGLLMLNPERPPNKEFLDKFKEAEWDIFNGPEPDNKEIPRYGQCSEWLSLNILVVSPKIVIIEEQEKTLKGVLEDKGFEVIQCPYYDVYSFGGSFHCNTWDIRRNGDKKNYFK
jgi:glycine amidinotransferase